MTMEAVYLKILNMSITASYMALAVIVLRLVFKKAPKAIRCIMWSLVGIRLVCPFSFESALSLIPSAETVPENIIVSQTPAINSGLPFINQTVNPIISQALAPASESGGKPVQGIVLTASAIWLCGIAAMLIYTAVSYLSIHAKVREAVILKDNVWLCDRIATPFILGIFCTRIYLPSSMNEADIQYVISHENAHLKRRDHILKPLAFLLLTVYWFNPVMWAAYVLLCRDIELACDERVIKERGSEIKRPYSAALINCSVPRRMIAACPLAFGENGVKERVKTVLNYRKPAFRIIAVAAVTCVAAAVCLLTNPKGTDIDDRLKVFLDCSIAEHYGSEKTADNYICVDYRILGTKSSGNQTTVYAWVLYKEYSFNGEPKAEVGVHVPAAVTAKKEGNNYVLTEYWVPRDGSYYADDIKEKFPFYLRGKALDPQKYADEQESFCLKSAQDYYRMSVSSNSGAGETESAAGVTDEYYYSTDRRSAQLTLVPQTHECSFSFSVFSSYYPQGTYEETDESVIMKTDDGINIYTFKKSGENLIFSAVDSSLIPKIRYAGGEAPEVCLPDGAVFTR